MRLSKKNARKLCKMTLSLRCRPNRRLITVGTLDLPMADLLCGVRTTGSAAKGVGILPLLSKLGPLSGSKHIRPGRTNAIVRVSVRARLFYTAAERMGRPPSAKMPARKRPVADWSLAATSSGVPSATMRPPAAPPSGPRSIR